jgi:hypothetical protein
MFSLNYNTFVGTMVQASGEISFVLPRSVLKAMYSTLILTTTITYSFIGFRRVCVIKMHISCEDNTIFPKYVLSVNFHSNFCVPEAYSNILIIL